MAKKIRLSLVSRVLCSLACLLLFCAWQSEVLATPFSNDTANQVLSDYARIGIVTAFPKPFGMFYDNRAFYLSSSSSDEKISLLPTQDCLPLTDINLLLSKQLANVIKNKWSKHEIIQLAIDPDQQLTGYRIEGIWGRDVTSVNIKNISKLMHDKSLDVVLAVVPVTYYLPPLDAETTGFGMVYKKNQTYAYVVYTILLYKNNNRIAEKVSDSKKLVFYGVMSRDNEVDLKNKRYACKDIKLLNTYMENQFFPLIAHQALYLLGDKTIQQFRYFNSPKKPYYYYFPH